MVPRAHCCRCKGYGNIASQYLVRNHLIEGVDLDDDEFDIYVSVGSTSDTDENIEASNSHGSIVSVSMLHLGMRIDIGLACSPLIFHIGVSITRSYLMGSYVSYPRQLLRR